MKQLAAARAVITIWSPTSVRSDWMRAEAGRAKADGKLIPVKTPDVAYADIPLPFGEMHTENVASTSLIRAAVVSQLAKSAVTPSPVWQITSTFKYQILTWIGIVGSAITLFANLNGVLDLADWARELVAHWHEWNQIIWRWIFGWMGVKVPKELVPLISFTLFATMVVIGANLSLRAETNSVNSQNVTPVKTRVGILGKGVVLYLLTTITFTVISLTILYFIFPSPPLVTNDSSQEELRTVFHEMVHQKQVEKMVMWPIVLISGICLPMAYLLYFVKGQAAWVLISSLLFLVMSGCLLYAPLISNSGNSASESGYSILADVLSIYGLLQICWMAVILFSPLQQLTRRLAFVVLGVLLLIVLSEISKLNLHQYLKPPRVSDSSIPAQIVGLQ
jgi:hypothetical protein